MIFNLVRTKNPIIQFEGEIPFYMLKNGPLILVDDDHDDQELMLLTLHDLGISNEIKVFRNGEEALAYLYQTQEHPFLILSDINMPVMDGIGFKKKIEGCPILKKKCIPFIFISTSPFPLVKEVCDLSVQGFFEKGNSLGQLKETLSIILGYWNRTKHLN